MALNRSEAVIQLGKKLVAQLNTGGDLLASWMAHDIAARIEAAETAPPEGKLSALDACAKAILELWRYRNALPEHLRPLGELEPVLRTLACLDVAETDHYYHPQTLRAAATADAGEDAKRWLEVALNLDYAARLLIQFALRSAAQLAASNAGPWVELARQAGAEDGAEGPVAWFVLGKEDVQEFDKEKTARVLKDNLNRLEVFIGSATDLVEVLRAQLDLERENEA